MSRLVGSVPFVADALPPQIGTMGLGGPRAVNPPAQSGDYQTSHTNAAMANRHFWQKLARKRAMLPAYTHKTICN